MPDATLLGRPLWYELQTTDLAAAEAFYTDVVGWTVTPFPGLPYRYATWMRAGGAPVGGGLELTGEMRAEGVAPHWLLYVGTPSLDTTVGAAERLGGAAVSPVIDIPTVGRMQVLRDPQGAAFSLFEPVTAPQSPEAPAALGEVAWLELLTTDAAAGLAFYQALFGWRPTEALDMGPMGTYQMFGRDTRAIGGVMNRPPQAAHVRPYWAVYFRVSDVHAAAERAVARGATIVNGPMEVAGGGWIVQGLDPQGALFSLFHQA